MGQESKSLQKKGAQCGTAGALQGAEGVDQESKSWQKKGAQGGTPGALQGAQGVGHESKSSQKKGAQGAGQEPGRGCAWEFKAFQKQCAHRVQAVDSPYMYSTPSGA